MSELVNIFSSLCEAQKVGWKEGEDLNEAIQLSKKFYPSMVDKIYDLILIPKSEQQVNTGLIQNGEISWENLGDINDEDQQSNEKAILLLKDLSNECEQYLMTLSKEDFVKKYENQIKFLYYGELLPDLFQLIVDKKSYISFNLGVTLFERNLYNLFYYLAAKLPSNVSSANKASLILKELLLTPELETKLGKNSMALIRVFFSAKGLNLRNLIWHGFIAEKLLSSQWSSLVLVLILSLRVDDKIDSAFPSIWDINSMYKELPDSQINPVIESINSQHEQEINSLYELISNSYFIVPGHFDLVSECIKMYFDGKDMLFMMIILPILEHSIRRVFCSVNSTPNQFCAQIDQYYSTLDGFGQKGIHQVLLDTVVTESNQSNLLRNAIGDNIMSILTDLFMMEHGPNLRGKLCHGDAYLTDLFGHHDPHSKVSAVVFSVLIALCNKFNFQSNKINSEILTKSNDFVSNYSSLYHPHQVLKSKMLKTYQEINHLFQYHVNRKIEVQLPESSEQDSDCQIFIHIQEPKSTLRIVDKRDRVEKIPNQKDSFVALVENWEQSLNALAEKILKKMEKNEITTSFSGLFVPISDKNKELSEFNIEVTDPFYVYDAVGCLVALCEECLKIKALTEKHLVSLEEMIANLSARTVNRRRYLQILQVVKGMSLLLSCTLLIIDLQIKLRGDITIVTKWLTFLVSFGACVDESDARKAFDKSIQNSIQFFQTQAVKNAFK
eukprot:c19270_g1_i1.p1 GENE.c19270_g1_i1~~c19270_g1_i1.p1  ORF type:complete len:726 (-),score=208.08 c19270_g1_i1:58-2235(-)